MVKYINMYTVFNSFGCLSNHDLISMTLMNGRALLLLVVGVSGLLHRGGGEKEMLRDYFRHLTVG